MATGTTIKEIYWELTTISNLADVWMEAQDNLGSAKVNLLSLKNNLLSGEFTGITSLSSSISIRSSIDSSLSSAVSSGDLSLSGQISVRTSVDSSLSSAISSGDLSLSGQISVRTSVDSSLSTAITNVANYWNKVGTDISPVTSGDDILIPTGSTLKFGTTGITNLIIDFPNALTGNTGIVWDNSQSALLFKSNNNDTFKMDLDEGYMEINGNFSKLYVKNIQSTTGLTLNSSTGEIYFGNGTVGVLPSKTTETNAVYYDNVSGKISYGAVSSGGNVNKVNTPLTNQVGVWTGDGTIEGTNNFTYDGTTLNLSGNIVSNNVRKISKITLTDAATIQWSLTGSCSAEVTLTSSRILNITNVVSGDNGTLIVIQGGTGSYTLTYPAGSLFAGGIGSFILSTVVGSKDIISFYYDGTNYFWNIGKNYS